MDRIRAALFSVVVVLLGGCVASYSLVPPGASEYGGLQVNTSQAWNLVPRQATPASRPDSKVWTQDGLLLDRILIIPSVPDGESIFKQNSDWQALPVFRADMGPKDIEELTESSIAKLFGEGQVAVETANLRPHRFGSNKGFLFDMEMVVTDGPNYGGLTGAFIEAEKLYMVIYLGAKPYYFEKHLDEARVIVRGATL